MRAFSKLIIVLAVMGALLVGYVLLATGQKKTALSEGVDSQDPSTQETYVSQVIISAPWGEQSLYDSIYGWYAGKEESKLGEFGMHEEFQEPGATSGLIIGPNSFTVAPNGDIYINDPLNKRVQRFGPNGEFISVIHVAPSMGGAMCVDKDNNIYIVRASRPNWFIDKYDQAGNLLRSYPIEVERKQLKSYPTEIETHRIAGIYCDNSGRICAAFHCNYRKVDKVGEKRKTIIDTTWGGLCHVKYAEPAFSFEEQKSLIRKDAYLGFNSAALNKNLFFLSDHGLAWNGYGNLYVVSFAGDTVQVLKSLRGFPLGCDENLNVYTEETPFNFYASQYDEKKHASVVRKYNSKGELVSTFRYWCGKPYTTPAGRSKFLDNKGNIYIYCESYKDGIKVIKWHKSE